MTFYLLNYIEARKMTYDKFIQNIIKTRGQ